ncbi:hypothetical protein TYRP_015713, partial [Tyrophagus putrescentiae]
FTGIVSSIAFSKRILSDISWVGAIWFLIEVSALFHFFLRLARVALFFCTLCVLTRLNAWHSNEMSASLKDNIQLYLRYKVPISEKNFTNFFVGHNQCCHIIVTGTKEIFSKILLAFLLTNIPINIYIFKGFVFNNEELLIPFYIALYPLAKSSSQLHEPRKMLIALQYCLTNFFAKLKTDDLINRLGNGPKYAISIGPFKEVTNQAILEIL